MSKQVEKIKELVAKREQARLGGGEKAIEKQHARGKYTARERIEMLVDEGSFEEYDMFKKHRCTNFGMEKKHYYGDGVVAGSATIGGRLVYVYAQDFTVNGGSLSETMAQKICKVMDMAMTMGAPVICMNDSGGARIQEGICALAGYGEIFERNILASGVIPQIAVIMGPCAGGAVYSPALMDFVFMVKNTSDMFLTGPAVIKSVTAEEVTAEELGGAMTHSSVSGVAHFACESEDDCIEKIKALLDFLPSNNMEEAPVIESDDDPNREDESLNSVIPDNSSMPYDMLDVIKSCVDDGNVFQVLENYALNIITCFARFDGQTVGIIANQPKAMAGCMDINCSDKAARFIRTCDAFGIPLLTLVDVPGFLPGSTQEHGGIIRHGAKVIYAYCEATVPKVTMILRKAYGGAYLAMCCKDLGSDIVYAWPTAEIAVMGAEGAANIIFRKATPEERAELIEEYKHEFNNPYKAAERGMVDDVIIPSTSRQMIIAAMEMLDGKVVEAPRKKHGNVPL